MPQHGWDVPTHLRNWHLAQNAKDRPERAVYGLSVPEEVGKLEFEKLKNFPHKGRGRLEPNLRRQKARPAFPDELMTVLDASVRRSARWLTRVAHFPKEGSWRKILVDGRLFGSASLLRLVFDYEVEGVVIEPMVAFRSLMGKGTVRHEYESEVTDFYVVPALEPDNDWARPNPVAL